MKKGFTLVEMLGVIVILSLLTLITYTGVSTMNKNYKEKEFEDYKKTLYMATETYISRENIEIDTEVYIELNDLIHNSYIDKNKIVENPRTKTKEYNARIKVSKDQAGVPIYEYVYE